MLAHDLCSTMQNAFRARHKFVALPHSTQSLGILSVMLRAGFITAVIRGTERAPSPEEFLTAEPVARRIWAQLKYRDERPVLNAMHAVSIPSKRIFLNPAELRGICMGRGIKHIKALGMGEIAVVRTQSKGHEWVEAREAVRLNLPGDCEVMCRAS